MVRLLNSLEDAGCRKPNCRTGSDTLHRHHKRHQAMWFGIWAGRRRGEERFKEFVERYHKFLKEDVEIVCDNHHAEIHLIYSSIIQQEKARLGKPLYKFTWNEAETLMDKLERAFEEWIKEESPGYSSRALRRMKDLRPLGLITPRKKGR